MQHYNDGGKVAGRSKCLSGELLNHGDPVRDASLLEDAVRRRRISRTAICERALRKFPHFDVEIVKRSDRLVGFVVVPKRWIVERTIAWLNRCRRLAKDWENLNRKALAFLRLASTRIMLRKLCNPGLNSPDRL
jgi:transposase